MWLHLLLRFRCAAVHYNVFNHAILIRLSNLQMRRCYAQLHNARLGNRNITVYKKSATTLPHTPLHRYTLHLSLSIPHLRLNRLLHSLTGAYPFTQPTATPDSLNDTITVQNRICRIRVATHVEVTVPTASCPGYVTAETLSAGSPFVAAAAAATPDSRPKLYRAPPDLFTCASPHRLPACILSIPGQYILFIAFMF